MTQGAAANNFRPFLMGYLAANGLQCKQVAAKRGQDPTTFSKQINGAPSPEEAFLIGVAATLASAERSISETQRAKK